MIDKQFGDYVLICDICGEEAEEYFDTFHDAVEGKKKLGWKSEKISKGWADICPECAKER
jgi:hypothetical protein